MTKPIAPKETVKEEKVYHIYATHPREISEWEDLKIDIRIKLTDEEFDLMKMQQLQVNEQKMLEAWGAKTISYTHMIEHIIKESEVNIDEKIVINHEDETDCAILKKYMEQLLSATKNHILKKKEVTWK